MKIIHDKGYTTEEKKMFKQLVNSNAIQSLSIIVQNMHHLGIAYKDKNIEDLAQTFNQRAEEWIERGAMNDNIARQMQRIWSDEGIVMCFEHGFEYGLPESASYFLDALDRISLTDYIPSEQDILRCRSKTTGIVEIFFHYKVTYF